MNAIRAGQIVGAAAVLGAGLLLGACSQADKVRANMSPELETIARTPEQRKNMVARSLDTNFRELNDDWDHIWLLDEPLHLSPYPIP